MLGPPRWAPGPGVTHRNGAAGGPVSRTLGACNPDERGYADMPGGRPPKYASAEERKAADAERKRLARASVDPSLPTVDLNEPVEIQTVVVAVMPPIEQYVADALLGAEIAFGQTNPNANMSTKTLGETLENAERYARWRYAGVLDGSIGGL